MNSAHDRLVEIYRERLKSAPYTYASKLLALGELTDEDIASIKKKLGFYQARSLLYRLGIDVDYTPGQDDGEAPRQPTV